MGTTAFFEVGAGQCRRERHRLRDDILRTLARIDEHALDLQALDASNLIRESLFAGNDAQWLRGLHGAGQPLSAVVEAAAQRWMNQA